MNVLQSIATVFLTMALVTMANKITSLNVGSNNVLFVIFYLSLRIKMYLDDMYYYKILHLAAGSNNRNTINPKFEVAMFILGIVFWFLWVLTIAFLKQDSITRACYVLAATILLGTIILFIIQFCGRSPEPIIDCKVWLISNPFYIISLVLAGYCDNQYSLIWLCIGFATLSIDCYKSKTIENIISVVGLSQKQ